MASITPHHKTLIALDFDHTLFNTTQFVQALVARFHAEFGITEKTFREARDQVKDCCVVVDIDTFIQKLPRDDKKALHDALLDVIQHYASSFIFHDVRPFLREAQQIADIIIITHGDRELQQEKISHSNLGDDISYHISTADKATVLAPYINHYEQIIFVDDKPKNIDLVKSAHPSVTGLFLTRPEDHPYEDSFPACDSANMTISSLSEIVLKQAVS